MRHRVRSVLDPIASRRVDVLLVGGLVALAAILPVIVGVASGSWDIPRNDDWSYRKSALALYQSGHLLLNGWAGMSTVGQIVAVQPVLALSGGASWAFSVFGVASALLAVCLGYAVVRQVAAAGSAFVATLLLVSFPGFLAYSVSFMTDVPAMAAMYGSLALGIAAIKGVSTRMRWLAASLVVGAFAFSIREYSLAAPASVLLVCLGRQRSDARVWLGAAALLSACLALWLWRSQLPGNAQVALHLPTGESVERVSRGLSSLALVLLPAALIGATAGWRRMRPAPALAGGLIGLLIVTGPLMASAATKSLAPVLLDGLATQFGVPLQYMTLGSRPVLIPDAVWQLANAAALVATIVVGGAVFCLLGAAWEDLGARRQTAAGRLSGASVVLFAFVLLYLVGVVIVGLVSSTFDRYFWPAVPIGAALMLSSRSSLLPLGTTAVRSPSLVRAAAPVLAAVLVAAAAATGLGVMLNSAAFDAARWEAAETLVAEGISSDTIDAGIEWLGYHATTAADPAHARSAPTWWEGVWPSFHLCGVVASQPQTEPGFVGLDREAGYRLLLLWGPQEPLYLYRVADPGCR